MTDSLPKEIVPSEAEIRAEKVIQGKIGKWNYGPTMAQIIAEHTRADGLTALQLAEKLKEAEMYGRYKDQTATVFMNQVKRLQKELADCELSRKIIAEVCESISDIIPTGDNEGTDDAARRMKRDLQVTQARAESSEQALSAAEASLKLADELAMWNDWRSYKTFEKLRDAYLHSTQPTTK